MALPTEVPKQLEPFAALHQSKKAQPGDFQTEVQRLVAQVLNPTDALHSDDDEDDNASDGDGTKNAIDILSQRAFKEPYWNYVWHFDHEYRDALAKAADGMVSRFRMMPDAQKKMFIDKMAPPGAKPQAAGPAGGGGGAGAPPPPAPAGGDPGMGMGAPMAASTSWTRLADHSMYLSKDKGRYKLRGSIASNLIGGTLQYMRDDGALYVLRAPKDVAMSRSGNASAAATLIQSEMPGVVLKAVAEGISSIDEAMPSDAIARAICDRAWATGAWNLLPISVLSKGVLEAFMLSEHAGEESDGVGSIRRAIGSAMGPYVDRLISALRADGVSVAEKALPMPACTEAGREQRHGQEANRLHAPDQASDNPNPSVLNADDAKRSTDVPSLIMTMASPEADTGAKENAIRRTIEVICKYPESYEQHKLSEDEAARIASRCPDCRHAEALVKFVRLFDADDADVMQSYVQAGGPMERHLISHVVSSQWRKDIIDAVPDMAMQHSPNGALVNNEFLGALDMSDPEARKVIEAVLASGSKVADNLVNRKVMEAIIKSQAGPARRENSVAIKAINRRGAARYFAMAWMLGGDDGDRQYALSALQMMVKDGDPHSYTQRALACVAFMHKFDPQVGRLAWQKLKVLPKDVVFFGGESPGQHYMRGNRIDHEGSPIPDALQFHSLPDDCEQLARNLMTISDTPGMLSLLHLVAKHLGSHPHDEKVEAVGKMLKDALDGVGRGGDAGEIMHERHASMLPDGSVMTSRAGVHQVHGHVFAAADADARRVAMCLVARGKGASQD